MSPVVWLAFGIAAIIVIAIVVWAALELAFTRLVSTPELADKASRK